MSCKSTPTANIICLIWKSSLSLPATPEAVVIGQPIFDDSIPKLRYYARYLTHIWVHINTLSFRIRDSMCGYRVYPVDTCTKLIQTTALEDRMAFDVEILVRLDWPGCSLSCRYLPALVIRKTVCPISGGGRTIYGSA